MKYKLLKRSLLSNPLDIGDQKLWNKGSFIGYRFLKASSTVFFYRHRHITISTLDRGYRMEQFQGQGQVALDKKTKKQQSCLKGWKNQPISTATVTVTLQQW